MEKMKTATAVKKVCFILLVVVLALFIGYFVNAYARLSDKRVPLESFKGKYFQSNSGSTVLFFRSERDALLTHNKLDNVLTIRYEDNVMMLSSDEKSYCVVVISYSEMYVSELNVFLYSV